MPPSRMVETTSWGIARMEGGGPAGRPTPRVRGVGLEGRDRYFRWSHAPSGIHLARLVVNSSGHTVTSWPPCHCSM